MSQCESTLLADGSTLRCKHESGHAQWHESGDWEWWDDAAHKRQKKQADMMGNQPQQEMSSLRDIKAKLDELDRKVYNVQQTLDVLRQSTLGLLTEEVRRLGTEVAVLREQCSRSSDRLARLLDIFSQGARPLAAKPKAKPAHKPSSGQHRS
jgi:hypothetical protein